MYIIQNPGFIHQTPLDELRTFLLTRFYKPESFIVKKHDFIY